MGTRCRCVVPRKCPVISGDNYNGAMAYSLFSRLGAQDGQRKLISPVIWPIEYLAFTGRRYLRCRLMRLV